MSFVSGSQVSASGAAPVKTGKKRGRKTKAEKALLLEQASSVAGGRASSTVGGASDAGGRSGRGAPGAAGAEDGDNDDEGPTEVAATGTALTKEQKEEEHRAKGMLINAFTPNQFDRYENWRAAGYSKAGVRRVGRGPVWRWL
jgi:transcription initiation factor TFIID subunit 11